MIRDQNLLNPDAPPAKSEPVVPKMLFDRDGDAANNGTGFGKPAKDLSINYVPVPYPDYPPRASPKPRERQLWRVLNASAITYLNLEVLYIASHSRWASWRSMEFRSTPMARLRDFIDWQTHIGVPPGGRVEFIRERAVPRRDRTVSSPALWTPAPAAKTIPIACLQTLQFRRLCAQPRSTLAAAPKPLPPPEYRGSER